MVRKVLALSLLAAPLAAFASVSIGGDYFLKGSEKTAGDLYAFGDSATFAGAVSGDAVAIAQTVTASGEVIADALIIGKRISLGGRVKDDARLLGAEIAVSGAVDGDLAAVGVQVSVLPSARVGGNLYVLGERMVIGGRVEGSVRSAAEETRIEGSIGGDVEVWGSVSFSEEARIGGDLIYHAPAAVQIPPGMVSGEAVFVPGREGESVFSGLGGIASGLFSLQILAMLALGCSLFFFARERTEEILLDVELHFWPRTVRGILIAFLIPLAAAALLTSMVGLFIGIALAALFLAALVLASACAALLVGNAVERLCFKRSPYPLHWRPLFFGALVLALVSMVPYVGLILQALLLLAALGGAGTVFYRHLRTSQRIPL